MQFATSDLLLDTTTTTTLPINLAYSSAPPAAALKPSEAPEPPEPSDWPDTRHLHLNEPHGAISASLGVTLELAVHAG